MINFQITTLDLIQKLLFALLLFVKIHLIKIFFYKYKDKYNFSLIQRCAKINIDIKYEKAYYKKRIIII